jgi:hypothetical protein
MTGTARCAKTRFEVYRRSGIRQIGDTEVARLEGIDDLIVQVIVALSAIDYYR